MPTVTANVSILPAGVPSYIASMAANQSKALSSVTNGRATFSAALPAGMSSYNTVVGPLPDEGLFRYSGGGVDHTRALMYMHGGGHNDHFWNGIVQFDFNGAATPFGFDLVTGSNSAFAISTQGQDEYSDGRPTSIHSYDNIAIDWIGRYFIRNGGSPWSSGGGATRRAWRFNFNTGAWEPSINGDMGDSDSLTMITGFDPVTRRVVMIGPNGRWRLYDSVNHAFLTGVVQIGSNSTHSVMAWVWPENFGLCWNADGGFFRYSLSGTTLTRTSVSMGGASVPAGYGACATYDPYSHRIWLYNPSVSTSALYEVSWTSGGASFTATLRTLTTQVPPSAATTHNYKRFGVLKDWGALGYVGAVNQNAYVFRTSASPPRGSLQFVSNGPGAANYERVFMDRFPGDFGAGEFMLEFFVKPDQSAPVGATEPVGGTTAAERNNWANENNTRYSSGSWWWPGNFLFDCFNLGGSTWDQGSMGVQFFNGGRPRWLVGDQASGSLNGRLWGIQNPTMPSLLDGQWHRITLVKRYTGTTQTTYELWVDGVLQDSQVSSVRTNHYSLYWANNFAGMPAADRQAYWGTEKQAARGIVQQYADYKGLLADVRFWNVARTPAQIAAGTVVTGTEAGLIGRYVFGSGGGTLVPNVQGYGAEMTLQQNPAFSTDRPY